MELPLNCQASVEAARKTLLRRRAYFAAVSEAIYPAPGGDKNRQELIDAFNRDASEAERRSFFEDAPAELVAAFILMLDEPKRVDAIRALRALDPKAFSKLLEGF